MLRTIARAVQAMFIASTLMTAAPAWATDALDASIAFKIPAQSLQNALLELSRQSSCQIAFSDAAYADLHAPAIVGTMPIRQALDRLLTGTGLGYKLVGDNTITIARRSDGTDAGQSHLERSGSVTQSGGARLDPPSNLPELEEIVVTAQKRAERLQDVPVPVTAISAEGLTETNQLRIQDYYSSVPGLNVTPAASGSSQQLTIRGITTGVQATNPTVGVTVDDVPYGASTQIGGGGSVPVPDIDPGDLERIEVLRGPQGTLYGASSLGGLLKFVTIDPSTDAISGRIQAGGSSVYNGADLGFNVRGSVNLPLGDTFAIRASGFTRRDPGYIDNVQTGQRGVNSADVDGARLSGLWKPSDLLSLKFSALYQDTRGEGFADVDRPVNGYAGPPLAGLQQGYIPGTGEYDRKVQAYSAILTAHFGSAVLTSITGYNVNQFSDTYDLTYVYGPYTQAQFQVSGTPSPEKDRTSKVSQEVRLADSIGTSLDWVLGGFYTHESSRYFEDILASDPSTGTVVGQWAHYSAPATYQEYAAFADLTVHFTSQFDVQVGGRESQIQESFSALQTGVYNEVFGLPSPYVVPEEQSRNSAFTYLVTPRFRVSSDLMVYARLASGYRPGGPNATVPGLPPKYDPDKTYNYEIGAKADFWDHRLSLDSSLYYIDWKDIQIFLLNPLTGQGYTSNGSRAKSQGLELSAELRPLTGMKLAGWVDWDDAELTGALPADTTAAAGTGDRLPYSSRFSANVSLEQSFPLTTHVTGFGAVAASYVGNRQAEFASIYATTPTRQDLPAYAKLDLRAGAHYDSWTLEFYANNVTDRRGLLSGGLGTSPPFAFILLQPRTLGFSISDRF